MEAINMLRSKSEEKRTLGLIKASKLCHDHAMLTRVFDTVGARFLDRLVNSGSDDDQVVLYEDVDVLRAISCVPESESSQEIVSMIPCLLDILKRGACSAITDACYQFLFLVSTTLHNGLATLYEYNGVSVLVSCMASLPDGSCSLNLAIRLVKSMLCDLPVEDRIYKEFPSELSQLVIITARQFALLHNGLKFEVLQLLSTLLSSEYASPLHDALRLMSNEDWSTNIRFGIEAVLRNRDASTENFHALVLAESLMLILGEKWVIGRRNLSDHYVLPDNNCLLLILESSRIEVDVLLNELAYLKYEAFPKSTMDILINQRKLAVPFSILEKIIKLVCDHDVSYIDIDTTEKVIDGLDNTLGVVLEILQDAKQHGQRKGYDLLASVRFVGVYLTESPYVCKENVLSLLGYILSIEGEDESSPFYSILFMLPMLCQITKEREGCRIMASDKGLLAVVECLIKMLDMVYLGAGQDSGGCIAMACDTVMNVLLQDETSVELKGSCFARLLKTMDNWTDSRTEESESMVNMLMSLRNLILETVSTEALTYYLHSK